MGVKHQPVYCRVFPAAWGLFKMVKVQVLQSGLLESLQDLGGVAYPTPVTRVVQSSSWNVLFKVNFLTFQVNPKMVV